MFDDQFFEGNSTEFGKNAQHHEFERAYQRTKWFDPTMDWLLVQVSPAFTL